MTFIGIGAASVGVVGAPPAFAYDHSRVRHHHVRKVPAQASRLRESEPTRRDVPEPGVAGYFGPPPFYNYGYGPYAGYARGDLGFALLGALNGGGFRGFVECGNYYARYPGACGF